MTRTYLTMITIIIEKRYCKISMWWLTTYKSLTFFIYYFCYTENICEMWGQREIRFTNLLQRGWQFGQTRYGYKNFQNIKTSLIFDFKENLVHFCLCEKYSFHPTANRSWKRINFSIRYSFCFVSQHFNVQCIRFSSSCPIYFCRHY